MSYFVRSVKMRLIIFFAVLAGIALFALPEKPPVLIDNRPMSAWVQDLMVEDYQLRTAAKSALLRLGDRAVPELEKQLHVREVPLQGDLEQIARRFGRLKIEWPRPALVRQRTLPLLAEFGPKASPAVPAVVENLIFPDSTVCLEAERVLRRVGRPAVDGLAAGLHSKDGKLRAACARVLKDCAHAGDPVWQPLKTLVETDRDAAVRAEAVRTLALICTNEVDLAELLRRALRDSESDVRIAAAQSVEATKIRPAEIVASLRTCLEDDSPQVRFHAARALWHLDTPHSEFLSVVVDCLADWTVGWQASYLLGKMKTQDIRAVEALIAALQRERVDRPLRSPPSTSFALGQIGRVAVPGLIRVLRHEDAKVRTSAVLALGFMRTQAREALPELLSLLKDRDNNVRQASALAIAAIEPGGKGAMAVLIDMLQAEDIYVRMDAAEALRKIDPKTDWQIASE